MSGCTVCLSVEYASLLSRPVCRVCLAVEYACLLMSANSAGGQWDGKYVNCPLFKKELWAYRNTYHGTMHGMAGEALVAKTLKEKCVIGRRSRS